MMKRVGAPRASDAAGALRQVKTDAASVLALLIPLIDQAMTDAEARDEGCAALVSGAARADRARGAIVATRSRQEAA